MLDVDGRVVSAEALVNRVEALIAQIEGGKGAPGQPDRTGLPALVAPVHGMRVVHGRMHPPEILPAGGVAGRVGALAKKVVRRATSWYVEPRFRLQQEFDGLAVDFDAEAYNTAYRLEAELGALRRDDVRTRLETVALGERLRLQQLEVDRLNAEIVRLEQLVGHLEDVVRTAAAQDEVRVLGKEVSTLLDRLGAEGVVGADLDYVAFEGQFRGDPADVAQSQKRYLSFFPPAGFPGKVVDLGCGRGEMLQLLTDEGHEVLGVDLDADMVQACTDKGLPAVLDDALHFLAQAPPDSLKGVFCAQVVEHLLTSELEQLVRLAHRALRADGVLVMETINPRSSFALGNHFYADTSHVRPVHPETLRFICEQIGFSPVSLEDRSPHPALELGDDLPDDAVGGAVHALLDNVFGYQDYVIVATK